MPTDTGTSWWFDHNSWLATENLTKFKRDANTSFVTSFMPSGQTANGGMLHPFSGSAYYANQDGSNSWRTGDATAYRSFCLMTDTTDVGDATDVRLEICNSEVDETEWWASAYTWNREMWKYGWDWEEGTFSTEQIVFAEAPYYCLDVYRDSDTGEATNETGTPVYVYTCDSALQTQKWVFDEVTGQVRNRGVRKCLGFPNAIWHQRDLTIEECDGTYQWDSRFFLSYNSTTPVHGSFYFDWSRNIYQRGSVQPRAVYELGEMKSLYEAVSSEPASKAFYDYTVWNTSVMSVVVAGNTTLDISTEKCAIEGCPGPDVDYVMEPAWFDWSDNASWVAHNSSIPCDHDVWSYDSEKGKANCADVYIWDRWTITLDTETPFLNKLIVRGTLIAQVDAEGAIGIHANLIELQGGRIIFGNDTHPFMGTYAHITLHGDMYVHGKDCTVPIDYGDEGCWKKMKLNGDLSLNGRPVNGTRTLVEDAPAGSSVLYLDGSADGWNAGDELVIRYIATTIHAPPPPLPPTGTTTAAAATAAAAAAVAIATATAITITIATTNTPSTSHLYRHRHDHQLERRGGQTGVPHRARRVELNGWFDPHGHAPGHSGEG